MHDVINNKDVQAAVLLLSEDGDGAVSVTNFHYFTNF